MTLKPVVHDSATCSFKAVDKLPSNLLELNQDSDLIHSISNIVGKAKEDTDKQIKLNNQQMLSDPLWIGSYTPMGGRDNNVMEGVVFYRTGNNTSFINTFVTLAFASTPEAGQSDSSIEIGYVTIYISDLLSNYTNVNLDKAIKNAPNYLPHNGGPGESTQWATNEWHGIYHTFKGYVWMKRQEVSVEISTDMIGSAIKVWFADRLLRLKGVFVSYPMGYNNNPNTVIDTAKRLKASSVEDRVIANQGGADAIAKLKAKAVLAQKQQDGLRLQQQRLNSLSNYINTLENAGANGLYSWVDKMDLTNWSLYHWLEEDLRWTIIENTRSNDRGRDELDHLSAVNDIRRKLMDNPRLDTNAHPEYLFSNIDWSKR